jgi:hypothetical protein
MEPSKSKISVEPSSPTETRHKYPQVSKGKSAGGYTGGYT